MQMRYEVPAGDRAVFEATVHAPKPPEADRVPDPLMLHVMVWGVKRPVPGIVLSVDGARVNVT